MKKQEIKTGGAPTPVGPYSQAVTAGDTMYCSGQLAFDPATGTLVTGDIAVETRQVMENLRAVLAAAGRTFEDVVKTTIYLHDMNDFPKVNEVYGGYFGATPPARSTVQVAALPKGAKVEIDCIAAG